MAMNDIRLIGIKGISRASCGCYQIDRDYIIKVCAGARNGSNLLTTNHHAIEESSQ